MSNPATLEPQTISEVRAQFEKHTVELYARVLEYQLRMACHYARNRLQRYLRNVALGDDWKAILTSIKEYEQSSRYDMEALDSSRLNALISEKDTALVQTIMSALYLNYESGKDSYPRAVPGKMAKSINSGGCADVSQVRVTGSQRLDDMRSGLPPPLALLSSF